MAGRDADADGDETGTETGDRTGDETTPPDPVLQRQFWTLVVAFNFALLGLSLGVMLVAFRGDWTAGTAVFAVGAFALGSGLAGYRRVTSRND